MWNFRSFIEMAAPRSVDFQKTYYHGTDSEEAAKAILQNGIQPPDLSIRKNSMLRPIQGKVYLTPNIQYAIIYGLGGDMAGSDYPERYWHSKSQYGYVFQISGSELKDIYPDEDSIGEFVGKGNIPWLTDLAARNVAPSRLQKAKFGEYAYWAAIGKQLMPKLTDWMKLDLIDKGAHIAHHGAIVPVHAWRIDKTKTKELNKDGSNFFAISDKIK